jgi:hypothetical protein
MPAPETFGEGEPIGQTTVPLFYPLPSPAAPGKGPAHPTPPLLGAGGQADKSRLYNAAPRREPRPPECRTGATGPVTGT